MPTPTGTRVRSLLVALLLGAVFTLAVRAEDAPPKTIAGQLQPFVDSRVLAGAVTLVASQDKVLDLSTVGFAMSPRRSR